MGRPYSTDLRRRFVVLLETGLSASAAGRRLLIARSTATRWALIWRSEKRTATLPMGGDRRSAALEAHAPAVQAMVEEKADIFLHEIVSEFATRGVATSEDAVRRLLARHGVTRKKRRSLRRGRARGCRRRPRRVARGDGKPRRRKARLHRRERLRYEDDAPARPVCARDALSRLDPSRPLAQQHLHCRFARADRVDAPMLLDGAMTGAAFAAWIEQALAPTLQTGDIVVCDNLSVHKNASAGAAIEARGAELRFLPAYSPDLNPIEMLFAKIKAIVRSAAARSFDTLCSALARALDAVKSDECANYLRHAGYAELDRRRL